MSQHTDYCLIHNDACSDVETLLDLVGNIVLSERYTPLTHATCVSVACLLIANSISQEIEEEGSITLDNAASLLQDALPHIVETILCACEAFIRTNKIP